MADRIELAELNISFVGGTEDLQKGAQQAKAVVTASFNRIADSGDKVERSTQAVDKSFKKLDTSAVNLAARINIMERAYDQFTQVARQGMALAQLGAQSERVEDRFQKFAATIGSSEELLAAFNKGSAGAVDRMTAMNSAALLVQQGLVTNNAEMEKTVEMATRLGDQTLGATHRLEFFSQLLKNQSIRLLDNFGISSGRVRTRILELQKATAGLSREEAFRIATFEEGQKALDVLGERVDDNALKFERATAKMQDMRVELGEKLAPAGARVMEMFASLNNSTLILIGLLTSAVAIMAKFSGGLTPMIEKLGLTGKQFGVLAVAIGAAMVVYEVYTDLQKAATEAQEKALEIMIAWSDEVKAATDAGVPLEASIESVAEQVNELNDELHKNGNILEDYVTLFVLATSENKIMKDAAAEAVKVILEQADSLEEANRLIAIYNDLLDNSRAKLDEVTESTWRNVDGLRRFGEAAVRIIEPKLLQAVEGFNWLMAEGNKLLILSAEADELRAESARSMGSALEYAALRDKRLREQQLKTYETGQLLIEMEKERMDKRAAQAAAIAQAAEEAERAAEREIEAAERKIEAAEREAAAAERATGRKIKAAQRAAAAAEREAEREAEAIRKVIEAHEAALNVQVRRAEQLKDATAEQVAGVAISELEKAQKAGLISFDEYAAAVVEIQDRFGLADDASRALTLGLANLVDGFIDGLVPASEFDNILESLARNAGILIDQFDELNGVNKLVERSMKLGGAESDAGNGNATDRLDRASTASVMDRIQSSRGLERGESKSTGGVTIYGDIKIEGVEDAEDFLRQLMSLME